MGLARAHPLPKTYVMLPLRSSCGPPYPLGRWSCWSTITGNWLHVEPVTAVVPSVRIASTVNITERRTNYNTIHECMNIVIHLSRFHLLQCFRLRSFQVGHSRVQQSVEPSTGESSLLLADYLRQGQRHRLRGGLPREYICIVHSAVKRKAPGTYQTHSPTGLGNRLRVEQPHK